MNVTQFTLSLVTLAATAIPTLAQSASAPAELQVPANQRLLMSVAASGDQIYSCQAAGSTAGSPAAYAWTLKAPEAELFDSQGQQVGQHYGGPSWELNDGSKIVGQLKTKVDAPQENAIPWLLLQVKSHEGEGSLSRVNWIQRVNTIGGKAPLNGCDATHQNQEMRVNYSANYYFYGE